METVLIVAGWMLCSLLAYGFFLGSFTRAYPYMPHVGDAVVFAVFGPVGLLASVAGSLLSHGRLSFRLTPLTTEERWAHFHEKHGILGRDYFDRRYN